MTESIRRLKLSWSKLVWKQEAEVEKQWPVNLYCYHHVPCLSVLWLKSQSQSSPLVFCTFAVMLFTINCKYYSQTIDKYPQYFLAALSQISVLNPEIQFSLPLTSNLDAQTKWKSNYFQHIICNLSPFKAVS